MPTVWKHPESKYWFAKITLPDGRRTSRTTKQTDKRAAIQAAFTMERVAKMARHHELTQSAVIKLARDLCEAIGATPIENQSITEFFNEQIERRKTDGCSASTIARYRPIVSGFLAHLGTGRASSSLTSLTANEIQKFRDAEIASGKGQSTGNFGVKVLRGFLRDAVRKGTLLHNPADGVTLPTADAQERMPFNGQELAALLNATRGTEWEGMILFGAHTGIRLADAAHLTWKNVELESLTLKFIPTKTRKQLVIFMHEELVEWLKTQPRGIGKAPVFPTLVHHKTGSAGGLSNAFSAIMQKAKIVIPQGEERTGKGRTFRSKGFHSMRHTMVSRMANADTSPDVRRAIAGHASDEAHRRYSHLNIDTQRRAVEKMPSIGGATYEN